MSQFLLGLLSVWFLTALVIFVAELTGHTIVHFFSEWVYYLAAAPVLLPVCAVLFPCALAVRLWRKLSRKIKERRRAHERNHLFG